eukprot:gene5498-9315_t
MNRKIFRWLFVLLFLITILLYFYSPKYEQNNTQKHFIHPKCNFYHHKRDLFFHPILIVVSPNYAKNLQFHDYKKGISKLSENCDINCFVTNELNNETIYEADVFISDSTEEKEKKYCSTQKTVLYSKENIEHHGFDFYMNTKLSSNITVGFLSSNFDFMKIPQLKTKNALASAFISNCWYRDETKRIEILKKLKELGVSIDSYGECENNIKEDKKALKTKDMRRLDIIQHYKFYLAFENFAKQDFVSEKFFESLMMGTIPVFVGTESISKFAPSEKSFLYIKDLNDTNRIASEMIRLSNDTVEYEKFLEWKKKGVSDEFKATVHDSTVNPFCKLCYKIADPYFKIQNPNEPAVFVREKNTYHFRKIYLYLFTLKELHEKILKEYEYYKPTWASKSKFYDKSKKLRVYKILKIDLSLEDSLRGDNIDSDEKVVKYVLPRTKWEIIFLQ